MQLIVNCVPNQFVVAFVLLLLYSLRCEAVAPGMLCAYGAFFWCKSGLVLRCRCFVVCVVKLSHLVCYVRTVPFSGAKVRLCCVVAALLFAVCGFT